MAIGSHVLRHVYEDETNAELVITVQVDEIQCQLTSSAQPINMPDDELLQAVCDLVDLHERCDTGLTRAVYRYDKLPDGKWDMNGQFSYA
ncbi:hypothetical protein [Nocardia tengchongensis]|uniref:hypothetical protein n=1 Tax=Nocardia tengchongensis TaxID=2055889 RepID=UPI0036AECA59